VVDLRRQRDFGLASRLTNWAIFIYLYRKTWKRQCPSPLKKNKNKNKIQDPPLTHQVITLLSFA